MIAPRLLRGIDEILSASFDALKDPVWLAGILRETGLWADPCREIGVDQLYHCGYWGLMQVPREMAEFLVLMSNHPVQTALEIGTYNGWMSALMTAYLYRWNPCLEFVTIDPVAWSVESERSALSRLLPLTFHQGTSTDFRGRGFDFCFIDGDHTYAAVRADYIEVGRGARICAFHDIHEQRATLGPTAEGGVPRFWQELKQQTSQWATFYEFCHCPPDRSLMGIGVRISFESRSGGAQL